MARGLNDYRYQVLIKLTSFKASELDVYCRSWSKSCTDKMRLPRSLSRDEASCRLLALTTQVSLVCMLVHHKQRSLSNRVSRKSEH